MKEFVNENDDQVREKILSIEWEKTVADMVKPLRSTSNPKGVKKGEEQLRRDNMRADRIVYIRETYNAKKLGNVISDAYIRNPYQPLGKVLTLFISIEIKAQEAAAGKK